MVATEYWLNRWITSETMQACFSLRVLALYIIAICLALMGWFGLTQSRNVVIELDASQFSPVNEKSYTFPLSSLNISDLLKGDSNSEATNSKLKLFENGSLLGPAHSLHEDIAKLGAGRFSHWGDNLIFSTRDNTDPRNNLRTYSIEVESTWMPRWGAYLCLLFSLFTFFLAQDFPFLLICDAIHINWQILSTLLIVTWRTFLITFIFSIGVYIFGSSISVPEKNAMLETSVDKIIVRSQYMRAVMPDKKLDLLFLGDSSCLMGINFGKLQDKLQKTTKSLCTMAFVGPRGWAKLLSKQLISSGIPNDKIVLVMHPVGFKRDQNWDGDWLDFLESLDKEKSADSTIYGQIRMATQNLLMSKVMFQPMPGWMGVYYGNISAFSSQVGRSGDAIDPSAGLDPEKYAESVMMRLVASQVSNANDFAPNVFFAEALKDMKVQMDREGIDPEKILIAITPVPMSLVSEDFKRNYDTAKNLIGRELNLSPSQFIDLPMGLPNSEFSSSTHLNRMGREKFTSKLSSELSIKLKSN